MNTWNSTPLMPGDIVTWHQYVDNPVCHFNSTKNYVVLEIRCNGEIVSLIQSDIELTSGWYYTTFRLVARGSLSKIEKLIYGIE